MQRCCPLYGHDDAICNARRSLQVRLGRGGRPRRASDGRDAPRRVGPAIPRLHAATAKKGRAKVALVAGRVPERRAVSKCLFVSKAVSWRRVAATPWPRYVDIPRRRGPPLGDALGDAARLRRGNLVKTGCGDAAAATWTFLGPCRLPRGAPRHVPTSRIPRRRGPRGDAATWKFRGG